MSRKHYIETLKGMGVPKSDFPKPHTYRGTLEGMGVPEKEIREQKEFDLVVKKTKEKKGNWLGVWLEKFTEKGTWDLARFRNEKDDWL